MKKLVLSLLVPFIFVESFVHAEDCCNQAYLYPGIPDLCCDWGLSVYGEFLYLNATEDGLDYAILETGSIDIDTTDGNFTVNGVLREKTKSIGSAWDPGFRIGLEKQFGCLGWGVFAQWTYVDLAEKKSASPGANQVLDPILFEEVIAPIAGGTDVFLINGDARSKWDVRVNFIDLAVRKNFALNCGVSLTPHAGLRYGKIDQKFDTTYAGDFFVFLAEIALPIEAPNVLLETEFKNEFYGIGPWLGLDTSWFFCSRIGIYGDLGLSLLWGRYSSTAFQAASFVVLDQPSDFNNQLKKDMRQDVFVLDATLGLQWDQPFCGNSYRFAIRAGWEHHLIFDQNKFLYGFTTNLQKNTPLTLQGLVVTGLFAF